MDTRKLRWTRRGVRTVAIFSWALLLIPATDAQAITFGEWATNQGWPAGYDMPETVSASAASINSLAGIGNYDWMSTPTTHLNLFGNEIASIESGDFTGLDSLKELKLGFNRITSIEAGDFTGLISLTTLFLSLNRITSVEPGDFTGLGSLTGLTLFNNRITSIESGDFTGLPALTELNLSNNRITSIESDDFIALMTLTGMNLGNNQIARIESGCFAAMDSLTMLALSNNQMTKIDSGNFTGLNNLTYLTLSNNQITSIESGVFTGLGKLSLLYIAGNTSLTVLNLERADFSSLANFDLSNDTQITRVSLRNTVLIQTALAAIVDGGDYWEHIGIGELPGVSGLDLSGVDFAAMTDLSPLYMMDHLTDLWLVGALNVNAYALDVLLDNLATMQDPSIEGALYLTQADFDALNTAGSGLLEAWDEEDGHQVEIIGLGDANADGVVNADDASILAAHWLEDGAGWLDGDFNGDGSVNDADAAILAAHWGEGAGEESVPEPGSAVLLAGIAVMGMIFLRRRKA